MASMIFGIGVDLADVKRFEKVLHRWGERFIHRVFTPDEAALCSGRAFPPSAFALRFAAKEAFSKAIGLGLRNGVRLRDIEVVHAPTGKPGLRLHGYCKDFCLQNGIGPIHVSLSDDGDYGVAMVLLERDTAGGTSP